MTSLSPEEELRENFLNKNFKFTDFLDFPITNFGNFAVISNQFVKPDFKLSIVNFVESPPKNLVLLRKFFPHWANNFKTVWVKHSSEFPKLKFTR